MSWRKRYIDNHVPNSTNGETIQDEIWELFADDGTVITTFQKNGIGSKSATTAYKVYRATLTQSGTDAPVATVLENTLGGAVVWTRQTTGSYVATLAGAFPIDSTYFNCDKAWVSDSDSTGTHYAILNTGETDYFVMHTGVFVEGVGVNDADDMLATYFLEVIVYY